MGCDIHIVLERKLPNTEWIGLWSSDHRPGNRPLIARRDYAFFAEIASIRGSSRARNYPKNVPIDVSRLAWLDYMSAPTDHHSASYMSPKEFVEAWRVVNEKHDEVRIGHELYDLLGLWGDNEDGAEYRVVFWFDN